MRKHRYVIISPCRDEATFLRQSIDTVLAQTVQPDLWVIVDDGSQDETPAILAEYEAHNEHIRVLRRDDRGRRSVGQGVVDAFCAGLETVELDDFDFLCKLDLDLELPPRYFETLIRRMRAEPRLGTCSGKAYYHDSATGALVREMIGDEMSVGAAKFYRTDCFRQIGGFVHQLMWDGIDCHRCRMYGWRACSWDDPELRFLHLRPMGSSQMSIWNGRVRHGAGQYFMGTSFPYLTASALLRMGQRPFVLGGLAVWWGYAWSMLMRRPRYKDREFRRFLRAYQWKALLHGKRQATRRVDERQRRFWETAQQHRPPVLSTN